MSDFAVAFMVMFAIIGTMSVVALAITMQSVREVSRREKSGRFPAAVEISFAIPEAMALVRDALKQDFAGVCYTITDDNAVTGCIQATALGIPTDPLARQAIDISTFIFFAKVTDGVTRIERNYIVRSIIDEDSNKVILATNAAFDQIFSNLIYSPPEIKKVIESSPMPVSMPPLTPTLQKQQVQIAFIDAEVQPTITAALPRDLTPKPEALPDSSSPDSSLPAPVTSSVAVHSQTSLDAENSVPNKCPSCDYPLDAAFSFCLHCGKSA